ncbi:unnamed protein product [Ectocarpus sp. 13 AM-2016]
MYTHEQPHTTGHNTGTNTSNNDHDDRGSARCLEAITIVLNQSSPKGGIREPPFISSTLQLQLACLELCRVCRSLPCLHITVRENLPSRWWIAPTFSDDAGDHDNGVLLPSLRRCYPRGGMRGKDGATPNRVPPLLPFSVTCGYPSLPLSYSRGTADLWTGVERLRLTFPVSEINSWKDSPLVVLPRRLKHLLLISSCNAFDLKGIWNYRLPVAVLASPPPLLLKLFIDGSFEVPVADVPWPPSLIQISFGYWFQQRLGGGGAGSAVDGDGGGGVIKWPVHLQQLSFLHRFEEPMAEVNWPSSLERLAFFGPGFNEPLAGMVSSWPSLRKLVLGNNFNQPIAQVSWLSSLQELSLGAGFHHTIEEVIWPSSLRTLDLGQSFNHPIAQATWPASLEELAFGGCEGRFNHPITHVAWPASIRKLTFGAYFDKPIAQASWPSSLRELAFGTDFNQAIEQVSWPPSLQKLTFGKFFNYPIARVSWPDALRELAFGEMFDQRIVLVKWPASLQSLKFGERFNQHIPEASWPDALQEIEFGGKFAQPLIDTDWPMSLRKIYISRRSVSGNRGSGCVSDLCGKRELSLFRYVR